MNTQPLSTETERRIHILFPPREQPLVRSRLIEECGKNLPGLKDADAATVERCRFAVLKLSGGDLSSLDWALRLARTDWRDLLMAAGFGESVTAHESWLPSAAAGGDSPAGASPAAGERGRQASAAAVAATIPEACPGPAASGRSPVLLTELTLYLLPFYPEVSQVAEHVQLHLWDGGSEADVEPASPYPAAIGYGNPRLFTGIRLTGAIDRNTLELCLRIPSLHRLPVLAVSESEFRRIQQALHDPVPFMAVVWQESFDSATFAAYPERYFLEGEWSRTIFLGSLHDFTYLVWLSLTNGRYMVPCFRWRCCVEIPPDIPTRPAGRSPDPCREIVKGRVYIFQITGAHCLTPLAAGFAALDQALAFLHRRAVQGRYILAECGDGVDMF